MYTGTEVAIIGLSGRFPEAENVDMFWENLTRGKESISFFEKSELQNESFGSSNSENSKYIKARGILNSIFDFDNEFFNYKPHEVTGLDPQVRIFHECAWEALEDAGYDPFSYKGLMGVFATSTNNLFWKTFGLFTSGSNDEGQMSMNEILAWKLSYCFNMKGPSIAINSECSSSLVALHLACRSLLSGDCDIAIAGGVSIVLPQNQGYLHKEGSILSADGHNRTFDHKASGTVFGNGAGVVILKILEDAIKDGDNIYAVVRGSAVNNDGSRKVGFTAPSVAGQKEVIETALNISEVDPESITYVETHGTATPLGDPIELEALKQAFNSDKREFCAVGSVKSNIGHLNAAAGICGIIKTTLALKNKQLPPSLHFEKPNPKIDFANSPFFVNTELRPWKNENRPLRAGVSSFGIGGTNAHVILEEAPVIETSQARKYHLLTISAKSRSALKQLKLKLSIFLQENPDVNTADVAYTMNVGRSLFPYRESFVNKSNEALSHVLAFQPSDSSYVTENKVNIVFMFPDQGGQYANMGKDLYSQEELFREEVDKCFNFLDEELALKLKSILYSEYLNDKELINQAQNAQPLLFIVEYALTKLLMSWGIEADTMIAYGLGEYVAALLSGVFSLKDCLKLVVLRSQLMQKVYKRFTESEINDFRQIFQEIKLNEPQKLYISGMSGKWIDKTIIASGEYWIKHLSETIEFSEGLNEVLKEPGAVLMEIGPGNTLTNLVKRHPKKRKEHVCINIIKDQKENIEDTYHITEKLGEIWKYGVNINWTNYYKSEKRKRTSLPTYPFERKRFDIDFEYCNYCIDKLKTQFNIEKQEDISNWFYAPSWKKIGLPHAGTLNNSIKMLVFTRDSTLWKNLSKEIVNSQNVITVVDGSEFTVIDKDLFKVNLRDPLSYAQLVSHLTGNGLIPDVVINMLSIYEGAENFYSKYDEEISSFQSMFYLVKEIGNYKIHKTINYKILSNNVFQITGNDKVIPERSIILGLVKTVPKEYNNINVDFIDVGAIDDTSMNSISIKNLFSEVTSLSSNKILAYRNNYRWEEHFIQNSLPEKEIPELLKSNGTYLITGGLGAIGLTMSDYLAEKTKANLILINRSDFPERKEWNNLLNNTGSENETGRKITMIKKMEEHGARVYIFKADVADSSDVQGVYKKIKTQIGKINGIVHCAGIMDAGLIQTKSMEDIDDVFRSKIVGTQILDRIFKNENLDFFVLCSSLSTINNPVGQMAYSCANNYLNAFAIQNERQPTKVISVCWDTWLEVGMAMEASNKYNFETTTGILSHEGKSVFSRILCSSEQQIFVSVQNLFTRNDYAQSKRKNTFLTEQDTEISKKNHSIVRPGATKLSIESLKSIFLEFMGAERIETNTNYFDLGLNSFDILQMNDKLKRQFNIDVSLSSFYANPTIETLYQDLTGNANNMDNDEDDDQDILRNRRNLQIILSKKEDE